jgi:hypothetical protein
MAKCVAAHATPRISGVSARAALRHHIGRGATSTMGAVVSSTAHADVAAIRPIAAPWSGHIVYGQRATIVSSVTISANVIPSLAHEVAVRA